MKPSSPTARFDSLLSRPVRCIAIAPPLPKPGRRSAGSGTLPTFGYYCLLPLAAEGRIFGGCEFIRDDNRPWTEKEYQRLHTFTQIVAVVTEQIQSRVSNNVDYDLLCRERDNFRILVAITNAVLSRLDIDELVSEVAKEIHRYFRIDAISVVLRSNRKGKLNIYSTHYLDASHPVHDQSEVEEARYPDRAGIQKQRDAAAQPASARPAGAVRKNAFRDVG